MKEVGMGRYILDEDGNPVEEPDLLKWGRWLGSGDNRRLRLDELPNGYRVSTVFLGLDHRFLPWDGGGKPILWETMVFNGEDATDMDMERYDSREDAIRGHERIVEKWKKEPPYAAQSAGSTEK